MSALMGNILNQHRPRLHYADDEKDDPGQYDDFSEDDESISSEEAASRLLNWPHTDNQCDTHKSHHQTNQDPQVET